MGDLILAIETSCDETAAAVVESGLYVRSNLVASQADLHARFGGVFPEMASRQHIRDITWVVRDALSDAGTDLRGIDKIAVTRGPGLSGSLLVGVNFAKGLAVAGRTPVLGVNHMAGHLYSNWLHDGGVLRGLAAFGDGAPPDLPAFPHLTLIVSGGHTELVLVHDHGRHEVIGATLDDAAGEAFDKAARMLGLGYPGGPEIERWATKGDAGAIKLPIADPAEPLDFSFSGLKTAVRRLVDDHGLADDDGSSSARADIAAGFQEAVVRALVRGVERALERHAVREVHLAGGVSANKRLRAALEESVSLPVRIPPVALCTDNAAMIAAAAYWGVEAVPGGPGLTAHDYTANLDFDVNPGLDL